MNDVCAGALAFRIKGGVVFIPISEDAIDHAFFTKSRDSQLHIE